MRILKAFLFCFVAVFFAAQVSIAQPTAATPDAATEAKTRQLQALLAEEWEYELRTSPETATSLGDNRYNNRLDDDSPQFHQSELKQNQDFLARFEALNPSGLSAQDALSRELMIRKLRDAIEGAQFKPWEMPVTQMHGIHLSLIEMSTFMPFTTVADYENYLARLHQVPHAFEQTIDNMRQGMKDRLMPPRYLLEKVTTQSEDLASKSGVASPFAKPVQTFPPASRPPSRRVCAPP